MTAPDTDEAIAVLCTQVHRAAKTMLVALESATVPGAAGQPERSVTTLVMATMFTMSAEARGTNTASIAALAGELDRLSDDALRDRDVGYRCLLKTCHRHFQGRALDPHGHPLLIQVRGERPVIDDGIVRTLLRALSLAHDEHLPIEAHGRVYEHLLGLGDQSSRRSRGAHYTPRLLTREMVKRTLGTLVAERPEGVHICDPSAGAGAFLIETARFLAERLSTTPAAALRTAVERCLFGVDIDPLAIEVARQSLWLLGGRQDGTLALLDQALRSGDALISPEQAPADTTPFDWHAVFPDVFHRGGFDAIVGNPPWVSYAGRSAQPLSEPLGAYYTSRYAAFRGWRALHAMFIERSIQLLRPQGRLGLLLPAQVADLDGYAAARKLAREGMIIPETLPYFGEQAFPGVTQPCFGLLGQRREHEEPKAAHTRPLRLSQQDTSSKGLLVRLSQHPRAPAQVFRDIGVHSGNCARILITRSPTDGRCAAVREGKNLFAFSLRPPKKWLRLDYSPAVGEYFTIKDVSHYAVVPILLRQTAKRPIAALHTEPTYFRNSLLGCMGLPGISHAVTVAWLNSSVVAWYHMVRLREAKQLRFPQVKIKHLRALPLPNWSPQQRTGIASAVASMAQAPSRHKVQQVDQMLSASFGLSMDEHHSILRDLKPFRS